MLPGSNLTSHVRFVFDRVCGTKGILHKGACVCVCVDCLQLSAQQANKAFLLPVISRSSTFSFQLMTLASTQQIASKHAELHTGGWAGLLPQAADTRLGCLKAFIWLLKPCRRSTILLKPALLEDRLEICTRCFALLSPADSWD